MIRLEDPLPMGEAMGLRGVPIVRVEEGEYYVDTATGCFRDRSRPRVCYPLDSVCGRDIVRQLIECCGVDANGEAVTEQMGTTPLAGLPGIHDPVPVEG